MKRLLKITTINVFKDDASWQEYRKAMHDRLGSIVDFEELESTGKYLIQSGGEEDGSESYYTLEELA